MKDTWVNLIEGAKVPTKSRELEGATHYIQLGKRKRPTDQEGGG
jgi:hypothetical protein